MLRIREQKSMSSLCIIIIKKNDNKVKCYKTELS